MRRNPALLIGAAMVALVVVFALISAVWTPYNPTEVTPGRLLPPSTAHLMGTDGFGQDIASRVLVGARSCLLVGVVAVGIGALLGVPLGVTAAVNQHSWLGTVIMRATDIVYAFKFAENARSFIAEVDGCPDEGIILDAGPKSVVRFRSVLANAQTILWNGPLGAFEIRPFDQATRQVALEAAELTRGGLVTSVAGGGDTVAALNTAGVAEDFSYVSTAGGAFLEWLEGKTLPGIAALDRDKAA